MILLVLLVIQLFPQKGVDYSQVYFLLILASGYNIIVTFIPWQERWKDGKGHRICHAESTLDIVFITGIIYLTEGLQSNFFLLYFVVIMWGATYYKPLKCLLITLCISLLYILIGILTEPSYIILLSTLLSKIPLLFAIAGISIYLSQEIKIQGEELAMEKEKLQQLLSTLKINLDEIDKKNKMLNEIYNLSLKIGGSLSLEDELEIIIDVTNKFLNSNLTVISLFDERKMELKSKVSKGDLLPGLLAGDKVKIEDSLLGEVIKTGEPLIINDLSSPEFRRHFSATEQKVSSLLSIPLKIEEKTIGVFTSAYSQTMEFKEEDLKFLTLIGARAALAINNARLHEEIKRLAITDGLTGLYNYRYFQEHLKRELERCKRFNHILSLLIIDIDHFKKFNDTYGHLEGDAFLQRLAILLNFQVRQSDVVCRYGGEEFVIITPETSKANAFLLGERIRKRVDERFFTQEEKNQLPFTSVSIGIASFPDDAVEQRELIECADIALYEAKRTGRNKVVEYKPELTPIIH